jgi:hypothetical protein
MVCSARQLVVVSRSLVGTVMVPCRYYKCPRTEICSLCIPRLTCCLFRMACSARQLVVVSMSLSR